jgi:hypothetical protein
MAFEAILLDDVEQLPARQGAACDRGGAISVGATSGWARAAKRKFRIVKRENNIPVLGVCEYCNAEFTADPETIGRPIDAHAHIQKQFIAHKCNRLDARKNAVRIVSEGGRIALSASGRRP